MIKDIICTICPRGCTVKVSGSAEGITSVEGYGCKRGEKFASDEFISPVRILTTTVKINGKENELLPVRSSAPLPKEIISKCMEVIKNTAVSIPVNMYDVVVCNICETGIDIVATKEIK